MEREKIIQIIKREFDIDLFFYSGESNANNMCGTFNIFLNDKLDTNGMFLSLETLILQIEKMRNKTCFNQGQVSKKINNVIEYIKKEID